MRMDDINPLNDAANQTDVMKWFADHKLKFNFGIIVGSDPNHPTYSPYWPTTCADSPNATYCDSSVVQFVNEAYNSGIVVGTGENAIFEIGSHAYNHNGWGEQWLPGGFYPHSDWPTWQENDVNMSATILKELYPQASIRYFAAPTNAADNHTLVSMKNHGLDIISAAGTLKCGTYVGPPYYLTSPCEVADSAELKSFTAECEPEGDVWATTEGFARVADIFSAPAGAANTNWAGGGQEGITVKQTIGVDDCGCISVPRNGTGPNGTTADLEICSLVSSAKNNADKSNGLHWTVLMMHPPSVFPNNQTYPEWLDEFYEGVQALEDFSVHFINFQDLVQLKAPGAPAETIQVV